MAMKIANKRAETVVPPTTSKRDPSCEFPQPLDESYDDETDRNSVSDGSVSTDSVSGDSRGILPIHSENELSDEEDESDSEDEEGGGEKGADIVPDGDTNADLHALLAFSRSRLEKVEAPPPIPIDEAAAEVTDADDESVDSVTMEEDVSSEKEEELTTAAARGDSAERETSSSCLPNEEKKESAEDLIVDENLLEIAKQQITETEAKAEKDDSEFELKQVTNETLYITEKREQFDEPETGRAHLLRTAEEKVKQAEEKAQQDEAETDLIVVKPAPAPVRRSDANAELWALLNYSKKRLETGAIPQVKKSSPARGDDSASVSSKRSAASRKSTSSVHNAPTAIITTPRKDEEVAALDSDEEEQDKERNNEENELLVEDDGSVAGSVGFSTNGSVTSGLKRSESDDEEDSSDDDSTDEEEDDVPDFLKFDETECTESEKRLYEGARSYGASVLSVAEENLTDVQLMQALTVAEEAARNGDEKFTTKSSIFRLHEVKLDDIMSILDLGSSPSASPRNTGAGRIGRRNSGKKSGEWPVGNGKLFKRMGMAIQGFKKTCDAIDEKKRQERMDSEAVFHF